jgi:hypothetical protein
MRLLVLDPRDGDRCADLFVIEAGARRPAHRFRLGYVPELRHDPAAGELLVVETELGQAGTGRTRYWLKRLDPDTFKPLGQVETPMRPMYAGFPGRSTRVVTTPSGRYIYVLELCAHPDRLDVYRTRVHRYDRRLGILEAGEPLIDSCMVEFGLMGTDEDELFFHLSCEFPSTVALAHFRRPDLELVTLCEVPARTSHLRETCGSWFDGASNTLYLASGDGTIYRMQRHSPPEVLARIPLERPRSVPPHLIQGGGGRLFVGVAGNAEERSLGMASEIWPIPLDEPAPRRSLRLPMPVLNFVVDPVGERLFGVNPYRRTLLAVELATGKVVQSVEGFGCTPGEVQILGQTCS